MGLRVRAARLLVACAVVACSTGHDLPLPSGPEPADTTPPVLTLVAVAGDGQTGTVGGSLPIPLAVAIRDRAGRGAAGVRVQFAVVGTNGRLTPPSGTVVSDSAGRARVAVTLGRLAEPVRVVVASPTALGTAEFHLVAAPSPAVMVVPVSGDSQVVALPGANLEPFVVAVRDTFGNALGARPVTFRVIGGAGSFAGQSALTVLSDAAGLASAALTTPAPAEGDTVRATASTPAAARPPLQLVASALVFRGPKWRAGSEHVCAVATDAQAYCWGRGYSGQLGNGSTADRTEPTAVLGGAGLLALGAGSSVSCGLTATGTATCWGGASNGAGSTGQAPYRSISVGSSGVCGVSGSGTVACWGTPRTSITAPVRFAEVTGGLGSAACGLTGDGRAWCWGANTSGEVGAGDWTVASTDAARAVARPVAGGLAFRSLSAGYSHVCGLTASGAVWCWGNNQSGQLGTGDTVKTNVPAPVAGGLSFAQISAGTYHTCGVTTEGTAYCWGYNYYGQLGIGTTGSARPITTPAPVSGGVRFASVSPGGSFTCGLGLDGAAFCWGHNGSGQLGNGATSGSVATPTPVTGGLLFIP